MKKLEYVVFSSGSSLWNKKLHNVFKAIIVENLANLLADPQAKVNKRYNKGQTHHQSAGYNYHTDSFRLLLYDPEVINILFSVYFIIR